MKRQAINDKKSDERLRVHCRIMGRGCTRLAADIHAILSFRTSRTTAVKGRWPATDYDSSESHDMESN